MCKIEESVKAIIKDESTSIKNKDKNLLMPKFPTITILIIGMW